MAMMGSEYRIQGRRYEYIGIEDERRQVQYGKNRYVDGRMWGGWNLGKGRLKEGVGDGDYDSG